MFCSLSTLTLCVILAQSQALDKNCQSCTDKCITIEDTVGNLTGQWSLEDGQDDHGNCWDGGCRFTNGRGLEHCICFVPSGGKVAHSSCSESTTTTTTTTKPELQYSQTTACEINCCKTLELVKHWSSHPQLLPGKYIATDDCQGGLPEYKHDSEAEVYFYRDQGGFWNLNLRSGMDSFKDGVTTNKECPDTALLLTYHDSYFQVTCSPDRYLPANDFGTCQKGYSMMDYSGSTVHYQEYKVQTHTACDQLCQDNQETCTYFTWMPIALAIAHNEMYNCQLYGGDLDSYIPTEDGTIAGHRGCSGE